MTLENSIRTILAADATLTGLLTGGLYESKLTGKNGFSKNDAHAKSAWETDADNFNILRPSVVIRERGLIPDYTREHHPTQTLGTRQAVELWFYDYLTYTTIAAARTRCYALLHSTSVSGIGRLSWASNLDGLRAEELDNAALLRAEYSVTTIRSNG